MSTGSYQFVPFVKRSQVWSANYEIFSFPTRFDVLMGFLRLKRLKHILFTFPLSPPICRCATVCTSNDCNFIEFGNFI